MEPSFPGVLGFQVTMSLREVGLGVAQQRARFGRGGVGIIHPSAVHAFLLVQGVAPFFRFDWLDHAAAWLKHLFSLSSEERPKTSAL